MCVVHTELQRSSGAGEGRLRVVERRVMFGDTPQDVCSSLGAPSKVFFKAEDKVWLSYWMVCVMVCVCLCYR